jgi:hypothetical protein
MPTIHVKFKMNGKKFGVFHRGEQRAGNRNLVLYQYDGTQWQHLEENTQKEGVGYAVGNVPTSDLRSWGKEKARWYAE